MLLATNLHAHGLRVITDIDHIDWNLIPHEMFGFKSVDIEILSISKLGDDLIANQLVVNAQVRQSMMQPAAYHNMIINGVPSNYNSRTSRQPKPDKVILTQRGEDLFVIGSTEKTFMKPPSDARRAFEKKLQKRWEAMQKKDPDNLHCKPSTVELGQMSMVARDRAKIEHVLDRCWDFFIAWCKTSERYKKLFRNGEPSTEEIALQRDCFRNGSVAHKTISQ